MKREFLEELGLDKEQIDSVMKEHGKTLNDVKNSDYDALKDKQQELQNQVEALIQEKETLVTENEKNKTDFEELNSKYQSANKTNLQNSAAIKAGIPLSLASRLTGETLEELEADAQSFVELIPKPKPAPMRNNDIDDEVEPLRKMIRNMNDKGED